MPTPNPEYNPDWKIIHDYHRSEIERLNKDLENLARQDESAYNVGARHDSTERQSIDRNQDQVRAEIHFHAQTCRKTLRMQHPTVQEYAAAVFGIFDPAQGVSGAKPRTIDFEKFTTLDEVGSAWSELRESIEDEARNERAAKTLTQTAKAGFKPS